jgi:hypothetical protein
VADSFAIWSLSQLTKRFQIDSNLFFRFSSAKVYFPLQPFVKLRCLTDSIICYHPVPLSESEGDAKVLRDHDLQRSHGGSAHDLVNPRHGVNQNRK